MTFSLFLPATGAGKESLLLDRTKAGTKNLFEEEDQTELPVQDAVAFTKQRLSMQPANNDDNTNTTTRTSRTCSLSTTDKESSVNDDSSSSLTSLTSILKTEESASNHQNQTHEKTVRFGHVHTRSFDIRMGDTTNCSCLTRGPPLVLSNSYVVRPPRLVSSFDARCGKADPLSAEERRALLIENFGYTLREILNAEHDIVVARHLEHKHRNRHTKSMMPQIKLVSGIKKKLAAARAG